MIKKISAASVVLLLTGCAGSVKSNFETDETEFPFVLLSQTGSLIPGVQEQINPSNVNTDSKYKSFISKKNIYIENINKNSEGIIDPKTPIETKNRLYASKIDNTKANWRNDLDYVSTKISEAQTQHLLRRRQYELRSDVFNVPILGGLIAIASSAFFKASTESVGGIAAGVGGLTASRDYFNVEAKRDLHQKAAIGMSCVLNEGSLLYGKTDNVSTISRTVDDLKDALEHAQRVASDLSGQPDLSENDKDTLTVLRTSIDAGKKAEAIGNKQISGYENMPYHMLVTASDLQKTILSDGGRGKIESGKVTDAVKVQLKEAASATNDIVGLREKLAEAKGGKLTVEDTSTKNSAKNLLTAKILSENKATTSNAVEKKATVQEAYATLVQRTGDVLNAVSLLGEEGEMSQVLSRITNCGAGLGKSGG